MSKSLPEQEENAHAGFWKISNSTYANGKSPKVENLQKNLWLLMQLPVNFFWYHLLAHFVPIL